MIFWPVLEQREGYWISPFSKRAALERVLRELRQNDVPGMLDLELPTTRNPWLYLTELIRFRKNKSSIREFVLERECYLAELYPGGMLKEHLMKLLGLHFSSEKGRIIRMLYHSLHVFDESFVRKALKAGVQKLGARYLVGLGIIARGVEGNEPLLEPDQLKRDLKLAQEAGVKEVVIFRLGGLNEQYLAVLKESCQLNGF